MGTSEFLKHFLEAIGIASSHFSGLGDYPSERTCRANPSADGSVNGVNIGMLSRDDLILSEEDRWIPFFALLREGIYS